MLPPYLKDFNLISVSMVHISSPTVQNGKDDMRGTDAQDGSFVGMAQADASAATLTRRALKKQVHHT